MILCPVSVYLVTFWREWIFSGWQLYCSAYFSHLGSVFFYNHELLVRVKMEKTAWIAAGGIVFAALVCQKEEVSPDFFWNVTAGIYGPLFLLLLLFGAGSARKKKALAALLALTFCP